MKKLLRPGGLALAAMALIQLSSCKKLIDRYFPHPGDGNSGKMCRIDSMSQPAPSDALFFYYFDDGRPKSIQSRYGDPSYNYMDFLYNDQKQLVQVLQYGTLQHSYHYTGNRITEDTTWEPAEIWLYKPVYDSEGRVVADSVRILLNVVDKFDTTHYVTNYDYDSNGNLQPPAPWPAITTYDNKVNALRTNDIWLFLTRNYSKNNKQKAIEYNSEGLPLKFDQPYFFTDLIAATDIFYHCE